MNIPRVAAAALLSLAAVAAQAATFDLTSSPFAVTVNKTDTAEFSDVYNFAVNAAVHDAITGSVSDRFVANAIDIDWGDVLAVGIYGGLDGSGPLLGEFVDTGTVAPTFSFQSLSVPGLFSIVVSGRATGSGTGVGTIGTFGSYQLQLQAELVPEPQTYAMLLAGLGVLGIAGLRRRNAAG